MGEASSASLVGQKIAGRYLIEAEIGEGGMATVFRAKHAFTGRAVAVKILQQERTESENALPRFLREARVAAKVRHPNMIEVIDVGEEDGHMYLVLELLDGESLARHLQRKGKLDARTALDILVPILEVLEALHKENVLHRDVKPGNIFLSLELERVIPKLLDLGISKPLEEGGTVLTQTGTLMGTPAYMSPEQARGEPDVGVAADIWAMGVVAYECLLGKRPFASTNIAGVLHKIATQRPSSLASEMPDLPSEVAAAVDRALSYEPEDRYTSAGEFADVLVEAAEGTDIELTCRKPAGPHLALDLPHESSAEPERDPNATPPDLSIEASKRTATMTPAESIVVDRGKLDPNATPADSLLLSALARPATTEPEPPPLDDDPPPRPKPEPTSASEPEPEPTSEPEIPATGATRAPGASWQSWAAASALMVAAFGVGFWVVLYEEGEATSETAPEIEHVDAPPPLPDAGPPTVVAEPTVEVDAGVAVVVPTAVEPEPHHPTRHRRNGRRATTEHVPQGANHAPIITD